MQAQIVQVIPGQAGKVKELQDAVSLLSNVIVLKNISDETKGVISIISEYSRGLSVLDDYDHERLSTPGGNRRKTAIMTSEDAQEIINAIKKKFHDSAPVGRERGRHMAALCMSLIQSCKNCDLYPWAIPKRHAPPDYEPSG